MTQETYNRLFRAVIKEGAKGNLTLDEIGAMGGVFMAMAMDLPRIVKLVEDYKNNQKAAKRGEVREFPDPSSVSKSEPRRKSLNKYSIKGLSKDHPAQKEFNKYMKGKEAKE